jgi:RNA polymerase sigma-70 factor (ECF subfamily)
MSTAFENPSERDVPPIAMPCKQNPAEVESKADSSPRSERLSLSRRCDSEYAGSRHELCDDDLITAAQCGDEQAFMELCGRYSALTKRKIFGIVRNHEDAEDAIQDTLLRAYRHLPTFRRSCKFSTWLTTIGVNSALMILRQRRVRREICATTGSADTGTLELREPADRAPGPEGIYLKQQAILLVRREIEKLHPTLRSVVNQYYGSECSLEEAAKAHEISLAAVKSRLMRGRVRLRSSLARYGIAKSHS